MYITRQCNKTVFTVGYSAMRIIRQRSDFSSGSRDVLHTRSSEYVTAATARTAYGGKSNTHFADAVSSVGGMAERDAVKAVLTMGFSERLIVGKRYAIIQPFVTAPKNAVIKIKGSD